MKRALILTMSTLLLITAVPVLAADSYAPFNPSIHNAENLPGGILYMETGKVDLLNQDQVVLNDATYPYNRRLGVFSKDGLKIPRNKIKKGQTIDLYANADHEAVYIVIK
ncbi:hypothetical protein DSLASN_27830 [Desulfoluna limicola]|uniref:Uncharacterized protein n=1 Tax=Desulfoluna limicola TaxID=2810562 RepID=A0ABN6F5B0_9BACT|nr:hypothetical protein [Desulfoluna limicola]BCS97151.1 hypothetical protein DSLASN_27830 [Desulfoluna limicola]